MASGVGEPRTYTRRQSKKRKEPSNGACSSGVTTTRIAKKGKERVVADDEPEFEELEDSEEEEEFQFDDSESEGEETDGYVSVENNDNDNDDYIGEDDED